MDPPSPALELRIQRPEQDVEYGADREALCLEEGLELLPVAGAPGRRVEADQPEHQPAPVSLARPVSATPRSRVSWARSSSAPSVVMR